MIGMSSIIDCPSKIIIIVADIAMIMIMIIMEIILVV